MNYNTPKLNQETNDKWAQFDTLSDHLRGHCKHQTEESMSEYKKHIGQHNDMMVDQLALPRENLKGYSLEPHEDFEQAELQAPLFEMQEVVDGLPEEELQAYKDQMLAEISDREAIVDAINRRLDAVQGFASRREAQARAYTRGVRSAITKQVKL